MDFPISLYRAAYRAFFYVYVIGIYLWSILFEKEEDRARRRARWAALRPAASILDDRLLHVLLDSRL